MTLPRWPRLLALALAAAAVVRLGAAVRPLGEEAFQKGACWPATDNEVEIGAALLEGVPCASGRAMPGWSVTNALLCRGDARARLAWGRGLALVCAGLLVFSLGWLLHSPLCGALALLAFSLLAPDWFVNRRWLCIPLAALAAYAAAWRARAPSPGRTWLTAGALAANLAVISTLFLFAPLLSLYEWAAGRGERRRRLLSAAVLCLAPLLFLAPWAYMNWSAHGELVLFERGRADSNVVSGALGLVESPPFVRLPEAGQGALAWAAGEALRHPLRTLAACGRRLWFAFSLQPLLFLAGLLALLALRRRPESAAVGLLAFYWVAIHCLMSVERDYFLPAWPLFLVLASALAARLLRLPEDPPEERWALLPAAGGLAAGLALTGFALALAAAYPARSVRPDAFDAALRRGPGQAWLWAERGARRLAAGESLAAAADYEEALRLDPQRDYEIRAAWAAAAGGRLDRPLQVLTESPDKREVRAAIIEAVRRLRRGEPDAARRAWAEALDMTALMQGRGPGGAPDATGMDGLLDAAGQVLRHWPEPERPRLLRDLSGLSRPGGASPRRS